MPTQMRVMTRAVTRLSLADVNSASECVRARPESTLPFCRVISIHFDCKACVKAEVSPFPSSRG